MAPLAVHISDGVLPPIWQAGGFVCAAVFIVIGMWRVAETEIPRLALFTAAFFVTSLIHVPIGPTSVHLLLNGLVGAVLGWRSGLAIAVGLFLQALLIGHGGLTALGVNVCVLTIPALVSAALLVVLRQIPAFCRPIGRGMLVAVIVTVWAWSLIVGAELVWVEFRGEFRSWIADPARWRSLHPAVLVVLALGGLIAAWWERQLETSPDFPLGILVGEVAVLLSVALNALVLRAVLPSEGRIVAAVVLAAHLPLAAFEGLITGFVISFLLRVAPHFLAGSPVLPGVERNHLGERHLPLSQPDANHG